MESWTPHEWNFFLSLKPVCGVEPPTSALSNANPSAYAVLFQAHNQIYRWHHWKEFELRNSSWLEKRRSKSRAMGTNARYSLMLRQTCLSCHCISKCGVDFLLGLLCFVLDLIAISLITTTKKTALHISISPSSCSSAIPISKGKLHATWCHVLILFWAFIW